MSRAPGCLFLAKDWPGKEVLLATLENNGFRGEFAASVEELAEKVTDKSNFLVFIEPHNFPGALRWLAEQGNLQKRGFFWIVATRVSKSAQSSVFYQLGASDILIPPLHSETVLSRAQHFIRRYVRTQDLPPDVLIPQESESSGFQVLKGNPRTKISSQRRAAFEIALRTFAPKDSLFSEIKDPQVRDACVNLGTVLQCRIFLWNRDPSVRFDGNILHYYPGEQRIVLDGADLAAAFEKNKVSPLLVHFKLGLSSLYMKAEVETRDGHLSITLPQEIFEVQRRHSLRMSVDTKNVMGLQISHKNSPLENPQILDLSAGGVQIASDPEFVPPVSSTVQVAFTHHGLDISSPAEVRWTSRKTGDFRAGLMFTQLDNNVKEQIVYQTLDFFGPALETVFGNEKA